MDLNNDKIAATNDQSIGLQWYNGNILLLVHQQLQLVQVIKIQ
ncbi:MAG: hypothetical protein WCO13_06420 [Bacteroidota bacterium]